MTTKTSATDRYLDYDESALSFFWALAPVYWLIGVTIIALITLGAVGYFSDIAPHSSMLIVARTLAEVNDMGEKRGTMAFSGIALAITVALSLTISFWAWDSLKHNDDRYRSYLLFSAGVLFLLDAVALTMVRYGSINMTTEWGDLLLSSRPLQISYVTKFIPGLMLGLAVLTPTTLAIGACSLLQPVLEFPDECQERIHKQQSDLVSRLEDLDQMLYVGAMALVFGTLQLSTSLSIPLAGIPRAAEFKVQAETAYFGEGDR